MVDRVAHVGFSMFCSHVLVAGLVSKLKKMFSTKIQKEGIFVSLKQITKIVGFQ